MMKEKNNTSHEIKLLLAYRLTLASGRVPLQLQLASDDGIGWAVGRLVLLADAAATMAGCRVPRGHVRDAGCSGWRLAMGVADGVTVMPRPRRRREPRGLRRA